LKKFSSVLGMKSLCLKSHQDEERCVLRCIIENTGDVLADSVAKEKEAYMILMKIDVETDCVTVGYDDS